MSEMSTEEKLLAMFKVVHGEMSLSCTAVVTTDTYMEANGITVMKDGNECWSVTKSDLFFDYMTKDWVTV